MNNDTFDYNAGQTAAYRVISGEANESDILLASDFYARNEHIRMLETYPTMSDIAACATIEALVTIPVRASTDAGAYASIGTSDGRRVYSDDCTVWVEVFDIATRQGKRVQIRTIKGTRHSQAQRRSTPNKAPRKDRKYATAKARYAASDARKAARKAEANRTAGTSIKALKAAGVNIRNLSAELVEN